MAKKQNKKSALVKPHKTITRKVLIGSLEDAPDQIGQRDLIEQMARKAVVEVQHTVLILRSDYGISLPKFQPEWSRVPTAQPSPSQTIAAYDGNKSDIRITIHMDKQDDDTTTVKLEGLGISHLIGISVNDMAHATWVSSEPGGMIALIDCPIMDLSSLVHDLLLDMAMAHAKFQPWKDFTTLLSAHAISSLKARFVREKNILDTFHYGSADECIYLPLTAFARSQTCGDKDCHWGLSLEKYIELWSNFAMFAIKQSDIQLNVGWDNLSAEILSAHVNGGQISVAGLQNKIDRLVPGHYCLYLLIRMAGTKEKVEQLRAFLQIPANSLRLGRLVIYRRDQNAKQAVRFLTERYLSVFPFYVGEK